MKMTAIFARFLNSNHPLPNGRKRPASEDEEICPPPAKRKKAQRGRPKKQGGNENIVTKK